MMNAEKKVISIKLAVKREPTCGRFMLDIDNIALYWNFALLRSDYVFTFCKHGHAPHVFHTTMRCYHPLH